jgi:hypothetical protein
VNYDPNFDQARLDQLADQCLTNNTAKGKVIFLSDAEDNSLDVASWRFEDSDQMEVLLKSEFKVYLMGLLDNLMIYRAMHNQLNARQGVLYVDGDQLELKWISREDAEVLRVADVDD